MFEKGMWIFYSLKMASTSAQTIFSKRFANLICDGQTKTILVKGHQQRRNYAKYMDQPDSNDEFHVIPMGESDIGHGARVSFLSKDMERDKLLSILSVSDFGFRLADYSFLYGPIAIFPKTALSWRVLSPQHITPESLELFFLLQPKLDVLIIGAGDQKDVDIVRKQIGHTITQQRIGYEIMGTEEAVATFNFLNAEHRYTAAALFPPREMTCTPGEVNAIKNELRMAEPEDPESRVMGGLLGVLDSFSDDIGTGQVELRNACYRIWGTRSKEAIENYEKIVKLSEEKQKQRQERIEQKMEKVRMERYLESRKRSEELAALAEEKSKKSHLESGKKKEKDGEDVKG